MNDKVRELKESELTQILADGFAMLYHKRPEFPVTFLANYLKNYNVAKSKSSEMSEKVKKNEELHQLIESEKLIEAQKAQESKRQQEIEAEQQDKFLKRIKYQEYHENILDEFCTWLETKFNLTGVYIGELKTRLRDIDVEVEDSEEAHLDTENPKLIYFEHYSKSHESIMKNQTLPQESIMGKLLSGDRAEGEEAEPEGEQDQEQKESKPKDEVYFGSVVDKNDIVFFKFPKLGAFFAICIKLKSYLQESLFEPNSLKVETYQKAMEEYQKQREERENKYKQAYEEKAGSGAEEEALQEMEREYLKEEQQHQKPQAPEFEFIQRSFVFGFDTLGQDREISKQEQVQLKKWVSILKEQWEQSQLEALQTDIDRHSKIIDPTQFEENPQEGFVKLLDEEDRELPTYEEVEKYKDNEKLMELEMDTVRIEKLKQYLADDKYHGFLEEIMQAKVLRFKSILKYWLIFCNYSKQQINYAGTNILDLRKAKKLIDIDCFIKTIGEYNPRGARTEVSVKDYAKWGRMQACLNQIDPNEVLKYNIYLALVLRFLNLTAKVRKADREKRIDRMKQQRRARKDRIKLNNKKKVQKEEKLSAAKLEAEEKEEPFDEQAWEAQYNEIEENQLVEIGPTIENQIDLDIENGEEQFPESEEDEPVQQENVAPE